MANSDISDIKNDPAYQVPNPFDSWLPALIDKGFVDREDGGAFTPVGDDGAQVRMSLESAEEGGQFTALVEYDSNVFIYRNGYCLRTLLDDGNPDTDPNYYAMTRKQSDRFLEALSLDALAKIGLEGLLEVAAQSASKPKA